MISSSYNNGVSQTRAYNSDNTLASITHAGAAIGSYTYSQPARQIRHENKNKTGEAISGVLSGFGFTVPASGYDGEDRLTAWNRSDNALSKAWNLSVVGDWNGVTENAQTQARTHGPTHELLSAAGQLIEHDVKGNTTKIPAILRTTDAANPQPDLNLSWDFDNRMRSASDGAVTVSYSFDALGRRVARTDSATTVVYVQNGQQTVTDYPLGAAAPSPTSTYVYASYIDEPVMRTGTGGDRYYHRNQQYSVTALTDATGAIKERYAYDAYGTPTTTDASGTSLTTSAENNRYTYTGREFDEALGLYHYRARMYDSVAGRFCSRDPIGFEGSDFNIYRYADGSPLINVDPTGELWVVVPVVAVGVIWWLSTPVANAPGPGDPIGDPFKDEKAEWILITTATVVCAPVVIPAAAKCGKRVVQRCVRVVKKKWVKRQTCKALKAAKEAACAAAAAAGGCTSGRGGCKPYSGREHLHRSMLFEACADARATHQQVCFKPNDPKRPGHEQKIAENRTAARNCLRCADAAPYDE